MYAVNCLKVFEKSLQERYRFVCFTDPDIVPGNKETKVDLALKFGRV